MLKKSFAIFTIIVMVFSAMALVDHSAAASTKKGHLIDKGTSYFSYSEVPQTVMTKWKTYAHGKKITIAESSYVKYHKKTKFVANLYLTMYKVSKTKIKYIAVIQDYNGKGYNYKGYFKTKLNARDYYWRVIKPQITNFQNYYYYG